MAMLPIKKKMKRKKLSTGSLNKAVDRHIGLISIQHWPLVGTKNAKKCGEERAEMIIESKETLCHRSSTSEGRRGARFVPGGVKVNANPVEFTDGGEHRQEGRKRLRQKP